MKKTSIVVLLVALLLIGCGSLEQHNLYDNDRQIEGEGNSYSRSNYSQNVNGNRLYLNIGFMDGMDTIWEYNANSESSVAIDYDISLKSGKAKLVLITPDGDLSTIAEATKSEAFSGSSDISVNKGRYRIKLVTENAKFELNLSASDGELGFD